jgi:hypothetical protein
MTDLSTSLNLTEPVGRHSCLVRHSTVQLGLIDAGFVLWEPESKGVCLVDDGAARLWFGLDGKPLSALIGATEDSGQQQHREVVDLMRVLRLLAMVEDSDGSGQPEPLFTPYPRERELCFSGSVTADDRGMFVVIEVPTPTDSKSGTNGPTPDPVLAECTAPLNGHQSSESPTDLLLIVDPHVGDEQELAGLELFPALAIAAPNIDFNTALQVRRQFRSFTRPERPADLSVWADQIRCRPH